MVVVGVLGEPVTKTHPCRTAAPSIDDGQDVCDRMMAAVVLFTAQYVADNDGM